jgi:copper chaperone CopZ
MQRYEFTVVDVTCEKCDARIREAVESLPGAVAVQLLRTPVDEATVSFESADPIAAETIEQAIEAKSAGTEHDYRVRWSSA